MFDWSRRFVAGMPRKQMEVCIWNENDSGDIMQNIVLPPN